MEGCRWGKRWLRRAVHDASFYAASVELWVLNGEFELTAELALPCAIGHQLYAPFSAIAS